MKDPEGFRISTVEEENKSAYLGKTPCQACASSGSFLLCRFNCSPERYSSYFVKTTPKA